MRTTLVLFSVLAAACAPQSAEITGGSYTAFLADGSSQTLAQDKIAYIDAENYYSIDCDDLGLSSPLPICDDPLWEPDNEVWLRRDGFRVVQEELAPWRGEAIVTSEGDLQIGFHNRLPGGEDFRFAIVVDPNFAPKECVSTETGVSSEPIDGDWVQEWSAAGPDGGTLFYLNSGSYQFNPSNTEQVWTLPEEWRAGFTTAKFAVEDFQGRRVRYGLPAAYLSFETEDSGAIAFPETTDLFYSPNDLPGLQAELELVTTAINAELALVGVPEPKVQYHDNAWRVPDDHAEGLDGWGELHYNWIRFDRGSELEVGGSATGEFFLTFDAQETQSRIFVSGEFEVKRFHRDRWTTRDVTAEKLEEAGTVLCQQ